jgi:hypothetical protein
MIKYNIVSKYFWLVRGLSGLLLISWIIFWIDLSAFAQSDPESLSNLGSIEASQSPPKIIRKKKPIPTTPPKIIRKKVYNFKKNGLHNIEELGLIVVKPSKREHIFVASGSSVRSLQAETSAKYVINWSYFWKNASGDFFAAGTLGKDGVSDFYSSYCSDVNLCSRFDIDTLEIQPTIETKGYNGNRRSGWPRLVQNGVINKDLENNRSHRQRKTTRTAIISGPTPYFIFSTTGYTLEDFASNIIKFFPNSSAINLDGGSSTSFYSEEFARNSRKLLPEFFLLW